MSHLTVVPGSVGPTVPRTFAAGFSESHCRHAITGDVSVMPQPLSTGRPAASKKSSRCGASEPPPLMTALCTPISCKMRRRTSGPRHISRVRIAWWRKKQAQQHEALCNSHLPDLLEDDLRGEQERHERQRGHDDGA